MQVTIVLHLHLARCTRDIFVTLAWEMGQFVFAGIKDEHPTAGLIFFGLLRMHEFL